MSLYSNQNRRTVRPGTVTYMLDFIYFLCSHKSILQRKTGSRHRKCQNLYKQLKSFNSLKIARHLPLFIGLEEKHLKCLMHADTDCFYTSCYLAPISQMYVSKHLQNTCSSIRLDDLINLGTIYIHTFYTPHRERRDSE